MTVPFTSDEIEKIVKKMKPNKSPGCDEVSVELIKYAPNEVHAHIAEIFNHLASEGDCPKEINHGILVPLQKPGKPRGPVSNLRPIILLSTLRKILAACIMHRIGNRLDQATPISQAAYRKNRSTTEHVFAAKLAIERTITAKSESIHIVMLDMSKAFDNIRRSTLIEQLESTIDQDELHIMKKMLEVSLVVRSGQSISEPFNTDTGAPQGDCASANMFTFYLSKSMNKPTADAVIEHEIQEEIADHNYCVRTQVEHLNIDMEYADDITDITSDYRAACKYAIDAETDLGKNGLKINNSKTEKYVINRQTHDWKKCKLLGSLLDTEEDIKRRKILATNASNNLMHLFENNLLTVNTKLRLIDTYIEPIFLYNSELWTCTKAIETRIDSFQRTIIRRYCLNIRWPKTISNKSLNEKTRIIPWSKKVKFRKLKWLGKIANLSDETPARKALRYAQSPYSRPRGKPKTTWLSSTNKILDDMNLSWPEAERLAKEDFELWTRTIKNYVFI